MTGSQSVSVAPCPIWRVRGPSPAGPLLRAHCVPNREHDAAIHALYLAQAARTKTAGALPEPPDVTPVVRSRSRTLDEEVVELLKLAKWWIPAHATTEQFTSGPKTKAST
ncbi:DUF6545 domain-containing protein [Mycobacterium decipiens]|uniref:DUF6545 domain-containing protein n=1 Tax=Mycobacterium decipiens TaxID=1430326 RepID=UPI003BF8B176